MGVVHEPVEDVIGQRRIAACSCQGETCSCEVRISGAHLVAVLADLLEVAVFGFTPEG
jgi:hypothetical protein